MSERQFSDLMDKPKGGKAGTGSGKGIQLDQIVASLKDMQRSNFTKETEWLFEKSQMAQRISQLEGLLRAQQSINEDLIKRVKMLEFCLREERIKYARVLQSVSADKDGNKENSGEGNAPLDIIGSVLNKANLNATLYDRVAKRRAKAQRPLLLKFLQEVGYEDIFNTDEINEIKDLYDKAQAELAESINESNSFHTQKLEEKLLASETLKREMTVVEKQPDEGALADATENASSDQPADKPDGEENAEDVQKQQDSQQSNQFSNRCDLKEKFTLRSHLDIVRGIHFVPQIDTLASISEDCMVKLWNMQDMESKYAENDGNLEPYLTLRGHTGPLLAVTGPSENSAAGSSSKNSSLLFTAGIEGCIRVWDVPSISEVNSYGNTFEGKNYCVAMWTDTEQEAFWDIKYHPFQDLLLSISAKNSICVWNCQNIDTEVSDNNAHIVGRFSYTNNGSSLTDASPAACSWLQTQQNQFAVGYTDSTLAIFDNVKGEHTSATMLNPTAKHSAQINTLVSHPSTNLICSAHEDGAINLFDFQANKVAQEISEAHSDAVSSLTLSSCGLQLFSGSHDGSVKVWDLRKCQSGSSSGDKQTPLCVFEGAHKKKYDEGVQCLSMHPNQPFLVSGGSDSLVKVFEVFSQPLS